ncbi:MAG TPA: ATP-dependent DNA ligase [Pirellulales bacterium]|jgi:ATP-dependent DNA ligase|nr:ATP-dependent DNA ligase [Pirellulales bacterium]
MPLELKPPLEPMEAELVDEVPRGNQWQYEPKWDGFRALIFKDGKQVQIQSKSGQPLGRYFPEVVEQFAKLRPTRCVLDGEIVIPVGNRLSFDDLLQRIHPAASRVKKLAHEHPALVIAFDLLADTRGKSLLTLPLLERRQRLAVFAEKYFAPASQIRLSPATTDYRTARRWYQSAGGTTDGVMAKRLDLPYQAGLRTGMQKIKPLRTADCVVGGFRYASGEPIVGSLLLGLYDDDGLLNHVGYLSGMSHQQRKELTPKLRKLISPPGFTGRKPGGPSRWSTKRSSEWEPLATRLVIEVEYDQITSGRFRHGTRLVRWRPDKAPRQCTFDQLRSTGSSLRLLKAAT